MTKSFSKSRALGFGVYLIAVALYAVALTGCGKSYQSSLDEAFDAAVASAANYEVAGREANLSADQAAAIVKDTYLKVLGRTQAEIDGDVGGVNFWIAKLTSGYSVEKFIADVRASNEFYVRSLYLNIFKRRADLAGLQYWEAQLAAGVKTRDTLAAMFRDVCDNQNGECLSPANLSQQELVVLGAYTNVIRRPLALTLTDAAGIAYWVDRLANGTTAARMAEEMRASDEFFVRVSAYREILKRAGEEAGVSFWLKELSSGRMTRAQVLASFRNTCDNHLNGECPVANSTPNPNTTPAPNAGVGALSLATAKKIVISIYQDFLDRSLAETQADQAGINYWAGRMVAGASAAQVQKEMKASDEYFIRLTLYRGIFKRRADAGGFKHFMSELKSGRETRTHLIAHFKAVCQSRAEKCR